MPYNSEVANDVNHYLFEQSIIVFGKKKIAEGQVILRQVRESFPKLVYHSLFMLEDSIFENFNIIHGGWHYDHEAVTFSHQVDEVNDSKTPEIQNHKKEKSEEFESYKKFAYDNNLNLDRILDGKKPNSPRALIKLIREDQK